MSPDSAPGLSAFAGLRVVELGVWVAAPSAAALLADWGADVIKVEGPAANGGIAEIEGTGTHEHQRSVNGPISFSDMAARRYAPVPGLGQHTDEVLHELADRVSPPLPAGP